MKKQVFNNRKLELIILVPYWGWKLTCMSLCFLFVPLLWCEGLLFKGVDLFQLLGEARVHHSVKLQQFSHH